MSKLRVSTAHGDKVIWPLKCAVCGNPITTKLRLRCSMVTKASYAIAYLSWSSKILSLAYPICMKHKILCLLPSLLSERNLFNTAVTFILFIILFVLSIPLFAPIILLFIDGTPIRYDKAALYCLGIIIAIVLFFIFIRKATPVMLHGADDQSITISITNESYAKEFVALNHDAIIELKK
jgi:hypothetical protein